MKNFRESPYDIVSVRPFVRRGLKKFFFIPVVPIPERDLSRPSAALHFYGARFAHQCSPSPQKKETLVHILSFKMLLWYLRFKGSVSSCRFLSLVILASTLYRLFIIFCSFWLFIFCTSFAKKNNWLNEIGNRSVITSAWNFNISNPPTGNLPP